MSELNLVVFEKENVLELLKKLEIKVKTQENKKYLLDEDEHIAKCHICKKEVHSENLGNVMPGSKIFFCENPACFSSFEPTEETPQNE